MNKKINLAVASAALVLGASAANAGIVIPAGEWTMDINGNVNAYASTHSADDTNNKETLSSKTTPANKKELNEFDGDWHKLSDKLKLGLAKKLAQECELIKFEDSVFFLSLDSNKKYLMHGDYIKKLDDALINHFNKKVSINIEIGIVNSSPAIEKKNEETEILKTTESAIMKDKFVNELISEFGAEIVPSSIKPIKGEEK